MDSFKVQVTDNDMYRVIGRIAYVKNALVAEHTDLGSICYEILDEAQEVLYEAMKSETWK